MIIGFDPSHSAVRRAAERLGRVVFAVFGPVSQGRIQSLDEPEQHQSTAAFPSGFAKNQIGAGSRALSRNAESCVEKLPLEGEAAAAGDGQRRRHERRCRRGRGGLSIRRADRLVPPTLDSMHGEDV